VFYFYDCCVAAPCCVCAHRHRPVCVCVYVCVCVCVWRSGAPTVRLLSRDGDATEELADSGQVTALPTDSLLWMCEEGSEVECFVVDGGAVRAVRLDQSGTRAMVSVSSLVTSDTPLPVVLDVQAQSVRDRDRTRSSSRSLRVTVAGM
jgi:hypothetical protein